MIPENYIVSWRKYARWKSSAQVEQDLMLSRIIADLYTNESISSSLAFRGGTAIYKLYSDKAVRYSEDIDLVQINAGPIGDIIGEIRRVCGSYRGEAKWDKSSSSFTLNYRTTSEIEPVVPLKFKLEINTREHFSVFGYKHKEFSISSRWYGAKGEVTTYTPEELFGTKMRALYQRNKGRDLFDIWYGIKNMNVNMEKVIKAFYFYLEKSGLKVSKKEFSANLRDKIKNKDFINDTAGLISPEIRYSVNDAYEIVQRHIIDIM